MPIIGQHERQQLQDLFARELSDKVRLTLFIRPESNLIIPGRQPTTSREAAELLKELVELSDKLELVIHDATAEPELAKRHSIGQLPALLLPGADGSNIRFFGLPSGYEFSTLVADLVDCSRQQHSLAPETVQTLANLTVNVHLQVFVTPT